ncbi:MAG: DUF4279 domain-containing protein [Alcaligenaceae bacterium]|jgi:hypothetical protein|nr:MAG: DUF4279 domain-containing protein [Alcaligenaceae bacterium]
MAHLSRSVATLRIMGDELLPEEVSRLLGAEPTSGHAKGQHLSTGPSGRTLTRNSGMWRLCATETKPENLDHQVSELLGQVTSDLSVWSGIAARFRVDLFCGWFMDSGNEGVAISPATMVALGQRGIQLSVDIYGPEALDADRVVPGALAAPPMSAME